MGQDMKTEDLNMNKTIIKVSALIGLMCAGVVFPVAAQRDEKVQRFLFERTDTNGDGFISETEFTASQVERFRKMDTDRDGKVSFEENKIAIEKMRKRLERFSR